MKHRATIKQQNETIDITVRHGQASAPRTTNRVWGVGEIESSLLGPSYFGGGSFIPAKDH